MPLLRGNTKEDQKYHHDPLQLYVKYGLLSDNQSFVGLTFFSFPFFLAVM